MILPGFLIIELSENPINIGIKPFRLPYKFGKEIVL